MAIKAYLAEKIVNSADAIRATFLYYDDQDPANSGVSQSVPPPVTIYGETFTFSTAWTNAQMQQVVQARGADIRTAKTRADALAAAFPVGTIIAVP